MKTMYTFLCMALLACGLNAQTEPNILWQNAIGGSADDVGYGITKTAGGATMVAGRSSSSDGDVPNNNGGIDVWLGALTPNGTLGANIVFGGSSTDIAYDIQQTSDGGRIFAGRTSSNDGTINGNGGFGGDDFWVVKVDNGFAIEWQFVFGGSGDDIAESVRETSTGKFIVTGYTNSSALAGHQGGYDVVVMLLNGTTGAAESFELYGGSGNDYAYRAEETLDGGYIVAGFTESNDGDVSGNHGMRDGWIFKLNSIFSMVWQRTHGGTADDVGRDVVYNADGTIVFVGNSESTDIQGGNQGGNDIFVVKYDGTGFGYWAGTWGGSGSDVPYTIIETPDNGWLIAASSDSNDGDVTGNHGGIDAWLMRLGPTSAFKWEKSLGGSGLDVARSVVIATGGGYTLAGYSDSNDGDVSGNNGALDYWVVKLDSDLGVKDFETKHIAIYPNPATGHFTIDLKQTPENGVGVSVSNLLGQTVFSTKINGTHIQIATNAWASGMYFVHLTNATGESIVEKLIVK